MKPLPAVPFIEHIGINHKGVEDGVAISEVELTAHHMNRLGTAHGGVIATLLDNAMVSAGRAVAGHEARLATIEMKISFMRAGRGILRCTARCVHSTKTLAFCEADVHNESGELIATASSTLQYVIGSGAKPVIEKPLTSSTA